MQRLSARATRNVEQVLAAPAAFLDHRLIRQIDRVVETRFTMLETTREYALEQLVVNPVFETIQQRHTRFYVNRTEHAGAALRDPKPAGCLEQRERDYDNLPPCHNGASTVATARQRYA